MTEPSESQLDHLWKEYSAVFRDFDDLTLARWMAQTLGQFVGRGWRLSHPLLGAYRLAAQIAHDRQIWFKRLATPPSAYVSAECCRAPLLPMLTREVGEAGLICLHCGETAAPLDDLAEPIRKELQDWAGKYSPLHAIAHWEDDQRKQVPNYDAACEDAATKVEALLVASGKKLVPLLLEVYPAVLWEDQDECLEVRPEHVRI